MTEHDEWGVADGWWATDGSWSTLDPRHPRCPPPRPGRRRAPRRPAGHDSPSWFVRPGEQHRLSSPATLELEDGTAARRPDRSATRPAAGRAPAAPHRRRPDHRAVRGARPCRRAPTVAGAGRPSSTPRPPRRAGATATWWTWPGWRRGPGTPAAPCWPTTRWGRRCPPSTSSRRRTTRRPGGSGHRCTCGSSRSPAPSCVGDAVGERRGGRAGAERRDPDRSRPGVGAQARRARADLGRHPRTPPRCAPSSTVRRPTPS